MKQAGADFGIDAGRPHFHQRGKLAARGAKDLFQGLVHFLLGRPLPALLDGDPDGYGGAVGTDQVACRDRILEGFPASPLGPGGIRRDVFQQGARSQLPFDALDRALGEKVIDPFDKGQLAQVLVQLFERLELGRCPQLRVAHVNETAMVGAEFTRHAQVGLALRVVARNQSVEPAVDNDLGQPESSHEADEDQPRKGRRRAFGTEAQEPLQQARWFLRRYVAYFFAHCPPPRGSSNTPEGT